MYIGYVYRYTQNQHYLNWHKEWSVTSRRERFKSSTSNYTKKKNVFRYAYISINIYSYMHIYPNTYDLESAELSLPLQAPRTPPSTSIYSRRHLSSN